MAIIRWRRNRSMIILSSGAPREPGLTARVGRKYSNEWHVQHLIAPRSVVPESIMPNYPWLQNNELHYSDISARMRSLKKTGVPYSESPEEYQLNVEKFGPEVAAELDINNAESNLLAAAESDDFDGNPNRLSEMDALVAYLQMLGTLVDFNQYEEGYFAEFR